MKNLGFPIKIKDDKKIVLAMVLSVLFTIIRIAFQNLSPSIEKTLLSTAVSTILIFAALKKQDKGTYIFMGGFSLIFAFFFYKGDWQPQTFWSYLLVLAFVFLFSLGASKIVDSLNVCMQNSVVTKKAWVIYFCIIVALWTIVFLIVGPVKISEDSSTVISEALGNLPLSDGNPVLYTLLISLFLKPFYSLGMVMAGAYLFGFIQLCVIAAILSYSLYYMEKAGCNKLLVWFGVLYFTLTPVFAINAITVWKDIPYNAVLLLLMIKLYEAAKTKGEVFKNKKYNTSFVAVCLFTCFLRGNGFFIILAVALTLIVVFRKYRKLLCLLLIPLMLGVKIIDGPIYTALGIGKLGTVEAQAMPLQMVARAVVDGASITREQEEIIGSIMPLDRIKEVYVTSSVDFIKFDEQFDSSYFVSHNKAFFKVWAELAPQNIESYTSAWLGETMGYWKLGMRGQTVLTNERFNGHEGIYYKDISRKLFGVDGAQWLFDRTEFLSLGSLAFLAIFTAFYFASRKRYRYVIVLLPLLSTWLGLMVGAPTYCDFRYMLVFPYALPFSLFLLFDKSK